MNKRFVTLVVLTLLLGSNLSAAAQIPPDNRPGDQLTPIVFFPGWGCTRLKVTVHNQRVAPECPRSGTFEYGGLVDPGPDFNQICRDKLLTLVYHAGTNPQFSEQRGVKVTIANYGEVESAIPLYDSFFAFLQSNGYQRNVNLRVAGYDFRLTPDMDGFVNRTMRLIEETYRANHNTPVHLVAHSNGPVYAQYLLTHTTQRWKNKYIHGFTPVAGNWPGGGWGYILLFTGFDVPTFSYPTGPVAAASSAAMYQSHPSTYLLAADPAYFRDQEVVIRDASTSTNYTPQDYQQLFADAGLSLAQQIAPYYFGPAPFLPPNFPNVDVYAEMGSGLETLVGIEVPDLHVGQPIGNALSFFTRDGDSSNEDITNNAIQVWNAMPCYHFELNDNPGVDHISLMLPSPAVHDRLLMHLQQPRSQCPRP